MLSFSKLLFATFLFIGTNLVLEITAQGCEHSSSGFEPHPTNCSLYYECRNGQKFRMECPPGEIFDVRFLKCGDAETSFCGDHIPVEENLKDLLIVFDATSSMHTDLAQLRAAAIEIVTELAQKEEDPINKFVLSVFRDPTVDDVFMSTNSTALINVLNKVTLDPPNMDCPELAMRGLKNALEVAAKNSIAFLFSDASAKDYVLYDEILPIIVDKQIRVFFLLTGNCNSPNSPGALVYDHIARESFGQVYNMKNTNVRDVLVTLSFMLDTQFESLMSFDFDRAGKNVATVNVDSSFETILISAAGTNVQLAIYDAKNQTVAVSKLVTLSNIKIVKLEATESEYLIESSAQSAYSIRVGGISDMSFDFGFSVRPAIFPNETRKVPVAGSQGILTVFVTNTENLNSLHRVSLVNTLDSSQSIEIPLNKISSEVFATAFFNVPEEMFKIRVFGTDKEENIIDRIISTGIEVNKNESTTASPGLDCSLINSGFGPHPTDCTQYFECFRGIRHTMTCPEGEIFDIYSLRCGEVETSVCVN